jgi:hypothetical protein
MINWMVDNWEWVCGGAALLAALLNVVTKHYSQTEGVSKVALWLLDILSVLTSGGAKPWLKLPLTVSAAPGLFDEYAKSIRRRVQEIKKCREKQQPPS